MVGDSSRTRVFAAVGAGALLALVLLEVGRPLNRDRVGLLVWIGALLAVAVLAAAVVLSATQRLKAEARRTNAIAIAAQRVGLAIDANEVAGAVLFAAQEVFSEIDFGGVLVFDGESELLVPLPVSMISGDVGRHPDIPSFNINPGEGVAGKVFLAARARCWGTPEEVMREHGNMKEVTREKILALTGGMRSVAAAPLRLPDRGVIGVLTLGSSSRENAWGDGDMVVLQGLAEQAALGVERARMYQHQRAEALTDPLTGLANYRQLKSVVGQEVARARRADGKLALVFCDLDGFKAVNDSHGHRAGDAVLQVLARSMAEVLRTEDLAARYGGDEFVCVLPGADLRQAGEVTERIERRFNELLAQDELLRGVATRPSCGCAVFPGDGSAADDLLGAADAALMRAKQASARDQVTTPPT